MTNSKKAEAMQALELLCPVWPAPARVRAGVTTRVGGISGAPYDAFNLAEHVQDDPQSVQRNRKQLADFCQTEMSGPKAETQRWHWLEQTHGSKVSVINRESTTMSSPTACDASLTCTPGEICVVLTADCLPILFCDNRGRCVAAVHAGWRGLLNGVIDNTLQTMAEALNFQSDADFRSIYAWLGPAIGPEKFIVGSEVRQRAIDYFDGDDGEVKGCIEAFKPCAYNTITGSQSNAKLLDQSSGTPLAADGDSQTQRYRGDLYRLATLALHRKGLQHIYGAGFCTASDEKRFFSYRRDGVTGRMASFIYLSD